MPLVIIEEHSEQNLGVGTIIGELEVVPARILRLITGFREFTAQDLCERYPEENVSVTAWNNRLNELYRLRLLRRRKDRKHWRYQTIAKELIYGRSILGPKK